MENDSKFNFDESCQYSFDEMKSRLVEAPIIAKPDWNKEFEIMCGASDYAVDEYLKYTFYPYDLVSISNVFMLNKCPNAVKVHTYDQVIHLVELCKIGGKNATEVATVF